ncbi:MAG: F0F1 ATP synthase subunit epsilon [Gammaproteobacteria bacterium]|jgi:F-type H+-transporting ATPase subunit epsilon|nr:F0F1 ATP synthase subunit epsilon [Gammaproteobacteria bacterium]
MQTFILHLQDATQYERVENVASFVAEDDSGSFGLLAGHEKMMTSLVFGLARYRVQEQAWQYLALPGALVYFLNNELYLSTRRFLRDDNYDRISTALRQQLQTEEQALQSIRTSLHQMEEAMLKRLWELSRSGKKML